MDQYTPEELDALRAEDRGPLCKRIIIAFTTLAFVSVCLRLFTRIRYHRTGWEDWTIVVSMAASIATAVLQIQQVVAGNGKHSIFVPYPEAQSEVAKYLYFSIITYNISLMITKISILMQYYRIFTLRELRIPVYVALVVIGAWGISTLVTAIFSCVPVDAYWKLTERSGAKCVNRRALWFSNASINIFTDLMIAVIPVRGIWNLQIPRRQKIALIGILTIGWFICIVSILRVYALSVFINHQDDVTYYSAPAAYWSSIEANLAIVCASLPALKPLIVSIVPVFGTRHSSRGPGSTLRSGNNLKLHKLSKGLWSSAEDKEKLTSGSSASHAHSFVSGPSECESHGRNIYVTKDFEQRVESRNTALEDSEEEITRSEFLAHGGRQ